MEHTPTFRVAPPCYDSVEFNSFVARKLEIVGKASLQPVESEAFQIGPRSVGVVRQRVHVGNVERSAWTATNSLSISDPSMVLNICTGSIRRVDLFKVLHPAKAVRLP